MRARKVVELGSGSATSFCGRLLALLGADVVKVEPLAGDVLRMRGPILPQTTPGGRTSASYAYANMGKRSVALNVESSGGREALRRVLSGASAVVYAADNRVMSLEDVRAAAPADAILTCLSHFGLTGPYAGCVGSDFTDWAAGGYTFITGYPQGVPRAGGGAWSAYAAGVFGAFMTLSAWLRSAQGTATAQTIFDISTQDVMVSLHQWTFSLYTHQGVVKRRSGNRHAESYHPMGFLPCRDGWVCVGVASIEQWEQFCIAVDMPELLFDPRFASGAGRLDNADVFDALVGPWFGSRSRAEVVEHLQQHNVPASPVHTVREALADDQLLHRGFWSAIQLGDRQGLVPQSPFPLAEPSAEAAPAPAIGQHTTAVLREVGFEAAEVVQLLTRGEAVESAGIETKVAGHS